MFWVHNNNTIPIQREKNVEELRKDLKDEIQSTIGKAYEVYASEVKDFLTKLIFYKEYKSSHK